jgi:hypothetical protein
MIGLLHQRQGVDMENRPEPRLPADLLVRVWGMSADGQAFFQNVQAHNISSEGALLSGLDHKLTAGDVVGVQYGDKKARFRVVWVIDAGSLHKTQAGVQLLAGQQCPWKNEIPPPDAVALRPPPNKRKFVRHAIRFPLEIRNELGGTAHMQTNATDISGRGCYVETLLPLPLGTALSITFWMESEKVNTEGIVRASDPGVGMGIEFIGLNQEGQQRLQQLLEKLDPGITGLCAPSKDS